MDNSELLKQWREGEERQRRLWSDILARGLYLQALGIDPEKRDSSWRNPPSATIQSSRNFRRGITGSGRYCKSQNVTVTKEELDLFQ